MPDYSNLEGLSLKELLALRQQIDSLISTKEKVSEEYSHKIRLITKTESVEAHTPYSDVFVKGARNLKGKWDGKIQAWVFPKKLHTQVRNLMLQSFSVTGEEPYKTCIITIPHFTGSSEHCSDLNMFGRSIAFASGRDSGAKLADDVYLISGEIGSSGSVKWWRTTATEATFEIHDFPVAALAREDVQKALEDGIITVL